MWNHTKPYLDILENLGNTLNWNQETRPKCVYILNNRNYFSEHEDPAWNICTWTKFPKLIGYVQVVLCVQAIRGGWQTALVFVVVWILDAVRVIYRGCIICIVFLVSRPYAEKYSNGQTISIILKMFQTPPPTHAHTHAYLCTQICNTETSKVISAKPSNLLSTERRGNFHRAKRWSQRAIFAVCLRYPIDYWVGKPHISSRSFQVCLFSDLVTIATRERPRLDNVGIQYIPYGIYPQQSYV